MKKTILFLGLTAGMIAVSCNSNDKTNVEKQANVSAEVSNTFTVDPAQSTITWNGYKLVKSDLLGHVGTFTFDQGTFDIKDGQLSTTTFSANTSTLNSTDQTGEMKEKLDGHLKSADFLDVEKFPTATFTLASAEKLEGDAQYNTLLKGNLKIKDVEKEIAIKANVSTEGNNATIDTEKLTLSRKAFNMLYQKPAGEVVINDEFDLQIKIVGTHN